MPSTGVGIGGTGEPTHQLGGVDLIIRRAYPAT
jgi:hypothetical protein